jgi:hypothetical protein
MYLENGEIFRRHKEEIKIIKIIFRKQKALTCMAHFQQGYLDQRPNQKEATSI